MIALLLLVACERHDGPWTRGAALGPVLARLDRDDDGRVEAAEYDAVAFNAPTFAEADDHGSGSLELDELEELVATQDPLRFEEGRHPGGPPGGPAGGGLPPGGKPVPTGGPPPGGKPVPTGGPPPPGGPPPGPPPPGGLPPPEGGASNSVPWKEGKSPTATKEGGLSMASLVLRLLCEEVLARAPEAAVPSEADIAAVEAAGLDSEAAGRELRKLRAAFAEAGLAFPASLAL